ncbi:hypothetical protein TcasGA2_TC031554 [Tribolium castaneum]|uniref:Uncharacterized protein n=1 Tax=Tribolium castaneum TaxID=7070 RepID=A0A139WPJ8_TRICA|nr:hypothetical protein TcasGA2_TC031554 [Tribolium castaneum]
MHCISKQYLPNRSPNVPKSGETIKEMPLTLVIVSSFKCGTFSYEIRQKSFAQEALLSINFQLTF